MTVAYMLAFCRVVIGLVFGLSFAGKVRDVPAFERTITNFKLLPERFSRVLASLFLSGELAVAATMLIGGGWLWSGFLLAALMLLVFSITLVSVLARKIRTSCNCFGAEEKVVSPYDVVRNAGFMVCALGGCGALARGSMAALGVLDWGLAGLAAAVFVAVWVQVGEIIQLLRF